MDPIWAIYYFSYMNCWNIIRVGVSSSYYLSIIYVSSSLGVNPFLIPSVMPTTHITEIPFSFNFRSMKIRDFCIANEYGEYYVLRLNIYSH